MFHLYSRVAAASSYWVLSLTTTIRCDSGVERIRLLPPGWQPACPDLTELVTT